LKSRKNRKSIRHLGTRVKKSENRVCIKDREERRGTRSSGWRLGTLKAHRTVSVGAIEGRGGGGWGGGG